ncbi:flagellar biosynthetic protein FliO [Desulfosporosinus orientis DSM 765]|uniref:Flagellar protein n=1 Tax=Desulfosporosinus orientis (strain ATCC 19365 / DSM 765 / NCIMB 8382 / VKM B-1628 / Singapore I) TaxID=768706 RepID=G7WHY4_DESOD|nr:flagellar biosynthetic protein FliO [Desulfosporosinus orientis]AET70281.1 flagellar biosynthetic protein FliO [Desulfosporosinus orientis DSM 765]
MPFNEGLPFPSSETAPAVTPSVFSWWGLLGTLFVFLIILFVSLWVLRRLNKANMRSMNAPWARVLDRQMLGGQQSLYLVEIAGQLQVLGGSDHHLVKISEINDPQIAAEILDEIAARPTERVEGWLQSLRRLWRRPSPTKKAFSAELERLLEEVEK